MYSSPSDNMAIEYITTKQALLRNNEFIAVSYVWSQCVEVAYIEQLLSVYKRTYSGLKVWLDRISNRTNDGQNDKEGIRKMNDIYSSAKYTLAIIPELSQNESQYEDMLQQLYNIEKEYTLSNYDKKTVNDTRELYVLLTLEKHIVSILANSDWFKRAWTFQEQILSHKIHTIINGKIYDITKIVHDLIAFNLVGQSIRYIYVPLLESFKHNGFLDLTKIKRKLCEIQYYGKWALLYKSLKQGMDHDMIMKIVKRCEIGTLGMI